MAYIQSSNSNDVKYAAIVSIPAIISAMTLAVNLVLCLPCGKTKDFIITLRFIPFLRLVLTAYDMTKWGVYTSVLNVRRQNMVSFVYAISAPIVVQPEFVQLDGSEYQKIYIPSIFFVMTNIFILLHGIFTLLGNHRYIAEYFDDFGVRCTLFDIPHQEELAKYRGSPSTFQKNGFELMERYKEKPVEPEESIPEKVVVGSSEL